MRILTKEQFLTQLKKSLKGISSDERQDILQDYEEHFAIGLEEGKTEQQIADSLGQPSQIARELTAMHHLEKVETTATTGNVIRAVWAVIGLGFFNIVIVLGPFIGLLGVIFAGWVTGVSFVASPILVLVNAVVNVGTFQLFDLFASIGLCGLGLLIGLGMFFITKWLTYLFVKYLKFNISLVKGGLKA